MIFKAVPFSSQLLTTLMTKYRYKVVLFSNKIKEISSYVQHFYL